MYTTRRPAARVAAFDAVYQWPTRVDGNQLDADYGAPTSGVRHTRFTRSRQSRRLAFRPMVRP
jgi:hypothetical protein